MGLGNSKSKKSYEVASADSKSAKNNPTESVKVQSSVSPPQTDPSPAIVDSKLVPKWLNETQFAELLSENVAEFSKTIGFRVKPAMAPGENYATLMLRISIDIELTGKLVSIS